MTLQNHAIHFKAGKILGTSAARNIPPAKRENGEESPCIVSGPRRVMLQADDSGTDVDLFKFSFYKI